MMLSALCFLDHDHDVIGTAGETGRTGSSPQANKQLTASKL